jgi:hypothetical protein
MSSISRTTSPIFWAAFASAATCPLVVSASRTALAAMSFDWLIWRAISSTEVDSSSAAALTVWTLVAASLEADATAEDGRLVS